MGENQLGVGAQAAGLIRALATILVRKGVCTAAEFEEVFAEVLPYYTGEKEDTKEIA